MRSTSFQDSGPNSPELGSTPPGWPRADQFTSSRSSSVALPACRTPSAAALIRRPPFSLYRPLSGGACSKSGTTAPVVKFGKFIMKSSKKTQFFFSGAPPSRCGALPKRNVSPASAGRPIHVQESLEKMSGGLIRYPARAVKITCGSNDRCARTQIDVRQKLPKLPGRTGLPILPG